MKINVNFINISKLSLVILISGSSFITAMDSKKEPYNQKKLGYSSREYDNILEFKKNLNEITQYFHEILLKKDMSNLDKLKNVLTSEPYLVISIDDEEMDDIFTNMVMFLIRAQINENDKENLAGRILENLYQNFQFAEMGKMSVRDAVKDAGEGMRAKLGFFDPYEKRGGNSSLADALSESEEDRDLQEAIRRSLMHPSKSEEISLEFGEKSSKKMSLGTPSSKKETYTKNKKELDSSLSLSSASESEEDPDLQEAMRMSLMHPSKSEEISLKSGEKSSKKMSLGTPSLKKETYTKEKKELDSSLSLSSASESEEDRDVQEAIRMSLMHPSESGEISLESGEKSSKKMSLGTPSSNKETYTKEKKELDSSLSLSSASESEEGSSKKIYTKKELNMMDEDELKRIADSLEDKVRTSDTSTTVPSKGYYIEKILERQER